MLDPEPLSSFPPNQVKIETLRIISPWQKFLEKECTAEIRLKFPSLFLPPSIHTYICVIFLSFPPKYLQTFLHLNPLLLSSHCCKRKYLYFRPISPCLDSMSSNFLKKILHVSISLIS